MPRPQKGERFGGRQKGTPNKSTIDRERALEDLRQIVLTELQDVVRAQLQHARGVSYMVLRHRDGTYTRATDKKQLDAALASGSASFQIFTQSPNTPAFSVLMDRVFGKAAERLEISGNNGGPITLVHRLQAARKRVNSPSTYAISVQRADPTALQPASEPIDRPIKADASEAVRAVPAVTDGAENPIAEVPRSSADISAHPKQADPSQADPQTKAGETV